LIPNRPQNEDGIRIEPPPSVASANGVMPAATLAPAPAEEPPVVLPRFHGLRVAPVSGLLLDALQPNSVVVVLPSAVRLHALGHRRVVRRDEIGERARAGGEAHALDRGEVLDRQRKPDEQAAVLPRHHRRLGDAGGVEREVGGHRHEGIERRLQRLEAPQRALDDFNRRNLPRSDQATQVERGQVGELL
jgi:hypothetical protein